MKNNVVNINSNGTILKFNELELIAEGKNYLMHISENSLSPFHYLLCANLYDRSKASFTST